MSLEAKVAQYKIPPIPYLPQGQNVLVFRLPNETVTAGGIIIAETAQEPKPMGVLVGAGLEARDVMLDALIEVGDVIWFGRFAGWEKEVQRDPEGKGKQILQMKISDVLGSVDALERVKNFDVKFIEDDEKPENSQHFYIPRTDIKRKVK